MPKITSHPAGTFCWCDLSTSDPDSALAFYHSIFGWAAAETSTDRGVPYRMLSRYGNRVCGLHPAVSDRGAMPTWTSYVRVANAQESADKVAELGGILLMQPMDVMDQVRLCFVRDPAGAVLGLVETSLDFGAELEMESGARCWSELQTKDPVAAAAFYRDLFGWTVREGTAAAGRTYWLFDLNGDQIGGMLEIEEDWGPVSPNWSIFFGVEDCDDAVAVAEQHGGKLLAGPMEVPGAGRFAYVLDPQGAAFAVIRLESAT